jgi:TonB family protein
MRYFDCPGTLSRAGTPEPMKDSRKKEDRMQRKPPLGFPWVKAFFAIVLSLCALKAWGQEARKALSSPQPIYPEIARRLNLSGVVKIEVVIGTDGQIKDTRVVGGHPLLVDAALKALRSWKYERASSETKIQLEFKFQS